MSEGVTISAGESLNLSSLTTLPEGITLTAGWSIYLCSLTTLPEGITLTAGWPIYLDSLTTLPEGVSLTAGRSLYLSSLTTLPKGVSLTAGRALYLDSLTTLPKGVSLTAGGIVLHKIDRSPPHLRPWREEMADCVAAFEALSPRVGDWCRWLHHGVDLERLTEPWRNRVEYVATRKPKGERAWRFRNMRPLEKDVDITRVVREMIKGMDK